jgi:thiamine pyrophosphate-dependent acetolactate synthase large subunit-like protein
MTMTATAACRILDEHRADAVLVSTMTAMRHLDRIAPDARLTLSSVPLMGGSAGLGAGLAMARPERKVFVLDGDASLLMELGVLATVAGAGVPNFYHFVFANGVQFNGNANLTLSGSQTVDFAVCACASGYRAAWHFDNEAAFGAALPGILAAPGPVLVQLAIEPEAPALGPGNPAPEQPDKRFERMGQEARVIMAELGVTL